MHPYISSSVMMATKVCGNGTTSFPNILLARLGRAELPNEIGNPDNIVHDFLPKVAVEIDLLRR